MRLHLGFLENNLSQYTEVAGKWLAAWEEASVESSPQSVEDSRELLHTFMIAVVAFGSASVFTSSSWSAFQSIFRPKKKAENPSAIQDMVYVLKLNPEWVEKGSEAVRAASTELYGLSQALEAVKTPENEFGSSAFHTQMADDFVEWKDSLRSSVWNPFEIKIYNWIREQVSAAETYKLSDVEWEPTYLPLLVAMVESASQTDVATSAIDPRAAAASLPPRLARGTCSKP